MSLLTVDPDSMNIIIYHCDRHTKAILYRTHTHMHRYVKSDIDSISISQAIRLGDIEHIDSQIEIGRIVNLTRYIYKILNSGHQRLIMHMLRNCDEKFIKDHISTIIYSCDDVIVEYFVRKYCYNCTRSWLLLLDARMFDMVSRFLLEKDITFINNLCTSMDSINLTFVSLNLLKFFHSHGLKITLSHLKMGIFLNDLSYVEWVFDKIVTENILFDESIEYYINNTINVLTPPIVNYLYNHKLVNKVSLYEYTTLNNNLDYFNNNNDHILNFDNSQPTHNMIIYFASQNNFVPYHNVPNIYKDFDINNRNKILKYAIRYQQNNALEDILDIITIDNTYYYTFSIRIIIALHNINDPQIIRKLLNIQFWHLHHLDNKDLLALSNTDINHLSGYLNKLKFYEISISSLIYLHNNNKSDLVNYFIAAPHFNVVFHKKKIVEAIKQCNIEFIIILINIFKQHSYEINKCIIKHISLDNFMIIKDYMYFIKNSQCIHVAIAYRDKKFIEYMLSIGCVFDNCSLSIAGSRNRYIKEWVTKCMQ